ncbi:MAG: ABC transporter permease [Clostridiales bacterium]|nr:ABC transporter permease [Clostridiales bacterium]
MTGFTLRNLLVYFKDKASVFFSLLAVFIIIGLYALFLGDVWVKGFPGMTGVRFMMDSWIVSGLLAVASVTTTMGAFGTMVVDKRDKITKDFTSSPMKRSAIVSGYTLSAYFIGVIMSLVTLVLAELYILSNGGELLNGSELVKVLGLVLLGTFTNTSIILFIVSFFKSTNAFSTASTIIGTLIGFLTGIYLPVGELPGAVQWVVKIFPVSHTASLFRQVIMERPITATFAGAPQSSITDFKETMGVFLMFGDKPASPLLSVMVLILTAALFYALAFINVSRKRK